MANTVAPTLRKRVFDIMELGGFAGRWAALFQYAMVTLIVLNVAAVVLETVHHLHEEFEHAFYTFEVASFFIFIVEYGLRLWVCVERDSGDSAPWGSRLKYALSPLALVDLFAILPFFFFAVGDLRMLRLFRLVRLLKLVRYSAALVSLLRVLYDERRPLIAALVVMVLSLLMAATLMYMIERHVQTDNFGTIPDALWLALATLTNVGYGDVVPHTPLGKFVGGLTMIFGLALYALPVGIMASGFSAEVRRRQFLVPSGLLTRYRLFDGLDELSLRDIAGRMRTRVVQTGDFMTYRKERDAGLFLIISGSAKAMVDGQSFPLNEGDYFGDAGFLLENDHGPVVVATERTRLLHLGSSDLDMIFALYPEVAHALVQTAEKRLEYFVEAGRMEEAAAFKIISMIKEKPRHRSRL